MESIRAFLTILLGSTQKWPSLEEETKMRVIKNVPIYLICAICISLSCYRISLVSAQPLTNEPGATPADIAMATQNPHEYAWRLFFFLNAQAKSGIAGIPDPTKLDLSKYDDDKPVVWETWALASGGKKSEVYRPDGTQPSQWEELDRSQLIAKIFDVNFKARPSLLRKFRINPDIDPQVPQDQEVRMNRSTFETIVKNRLFNVQGLQAKYEEALVSGNRGIIKFEPAAKEVKGQWKRLEKTEDRKRYHWRKVGEQYWGLVGLHIITKDLPNWVWIDFEHVDSEINAIDKSADPTTRGDSPFSGMNGIRKETIGTKWEYYRLRGVQIDFTKPFGLPTTLANTQLEPGFETTSSCITCHARASVGRSPQAKPRRAYSLEIFKRADDKVTEGHVGSPDPSWFSDAEEKIWFIQTDFLWSMPFRARSTP
jgi:hypothetical protein